MEGTPETLRDKIGDEETRVVLLKPGDVLLIGNLGHLDMHECDNAGKLLWKLGIRTVFFGADIDLGSIEARELRALVDGELNTDGR